MYYQPNSAGIWPNMYQYNTQQQQAIPAAYYQVPSLPTATVPEAYVQQQQPVPTVYYQLPPVTVPPIQTATTSEVVAPQPQTTTTTTRSVTTRVLDPSTIPTVGNKSVVEETKTTTVNKPEVTTVDVPPVTTTAIAPTIETTRISERPNHRHRRLRTLSTSTSSDDTTTSTSSTVTPRPAIFPQQTILPPQFPFQTIGIPPVHRVVHRPPSSASGYRSSDLDYGKRKVYKTDYKYRHYYCCNFCRGRCDLHNRPYGCCEWFYGCPLWALLICGLFFLALLAGFFALLGLQPSINPTRRAETAETRLLNRTQIIYGFYQNCGYQVNATNVPTTQVLCTNTATTTTALIQLSPFYTVISGTNYFSYNKLLIFFCYIFVLKNQEFYINIHL
jgi:hypothetical protein